MQEKPQVRPRLTRRNANMEPPSCGIFQLKLFWIESCKSEEPQIVKPLSMAKILNLNSARMDKNWKNSYLDVFLCLCCEEDGLTKPSPQDMKLEINRRKFLKTTTRRFKVTRLHHNWTRVQVHAVTMIEFSTYKLRFMEKMNLHWMKESGHKNLYTQNMND